jgi:hypothetical protein
MPDPGAPAQPESKFDGKVVRGKDGWLFLDNDSNQFMRQHTGELGFSDDELWQWQRLLENRVAWLGTRGIPYHFLVAPNPHSVFPDKLPAGVEPKAERPVLQLIGREGTGTRVDSPAPRWTRTALAVESDS